MLTLCRVEWLLRRSPIAEVCAGLGIALGRPTADQLAEGIAVDRAWDKRRWTVLNRLRAVDQVVALWPFGDTCLRRCLVLAVLLRADRPVLRLGVKRDPDGAVVAHSWLEVAGLSLDPTSESYLRLAG